jgi:hypothetical protein
VQRSRFSSRSLAAEGERERVAVAEDFITTKEVPSSSITYANRASRDSPEIPANAPVRIRASL